MFESHRKREETIRTRAYLLWESEGRPEGEPEIFWARARGLIDAEGDAFYPAAQRAFHPSALSWSSIFRR